MVIKFISKHRTTKFLSIAYRDRDGKLGETVICDWNTVPGTLLIYWGAYTVERIPLASFKEAVRYIFGIRSLSETCAS